MKRTLSAFLGFLFVAGIVYFYNQYPIKTIKVISDSMNPTIVKGDRLFMIEFKPDKPRNVKHGDIISLKNPDEGDMELVKRVIALGGDHVNIKKGNLYLNKKEVKEHYLKEKNIVYEYGPVEIPEGEVFVLGDNRNNSWDSSVWGSVPKEDILGKAILVYYPRSHFGSYLGTKP